MIVSSQVVIAAVMRLDAFIHLVPWYGIKNYSRPKLRDRESSARNLGRIKHAGYLKIARVEVATARIVYLTIRRLSEFLKRAQQVLGRAILAFAQCAA